MGEKTEGLFEKWDRENPDVVGSKEMRMCLWYVSEIERSAATLGQDTDIIDVCVDALKNTLDKIVEETNEPRHSFRNIALYGTPEGC